MSAEPTDFRGTPGPWVVVPSSRGGDFIEQGVLCEEDGEGMNFIKCPGSGGAMSYTRTICQMHWTGTAEWRANTTIMAASKDLLASLQGLFEGGFIEAGTREHNAWANELERRLVPCRAAIARAVEVEKP